MRALLLLLAVVSLVLLAAEATVHQRPSDCDCLGVHSISFQYVGDKEVRAVLYGQATPSEFNHIESGHVFRLDGTYGPEGLLGPSSLKLHLFAQYGSKEEFEDHSFKVLKCTEPKLGEQYGSLAVVKVVRRWASPECLLDPVSESAPVEARGYQREVLLPPYPPPPPHYQPPPGYELPCHLKVAVVVDVSEGTASSEALIKGMIKSEVVDHLSGKTVHVAVYCFGTNAFESIGYTSVETPSGAQDVKAAVDGIVFSTGAPYWYTDWEQALTLVRTTSATPPDLVVMITANNPTVHVNSPYVPNDYADDLAAGIDAATQLKANGRTRIIAIGVGGAVSATNLQAISGPRINSDYFTADTYAHVQSVLHDLFNVVCCPEDKDACGVCFGDGSSCASCDPHSHRYLEYDVCGVCGGNGSSCSVPTCTHEATLTVREETWFDIVSHKAYGLFEFTYHTNFIANSGVVLGFDSYQECSPRLRGSCDNRPKSLVGEEVPFCDLFLVEHPEENPFNGWQRDINFYDQTVRYRRNFTLDDLVGCRAPDGSGGLIHVTQETSGGHGHGHQPPTSQHYRGVLYGTVIKLPHDVDCPFVPSGNSHHYAPSPEPCEKAVISTHYNFEIWVRSGGELYSTIMVSKLEIEPKWLGNVWLQSGDVVVRFSTRIKRLHDDEEDTILADAHVVSEQETGAVPFHVIDTNVECTPGRDECEQFWEIRSYGGVGVLDFSGLKPVRFTVQVGGQVHVTALVNLDLVIKRHSDPMVDNQLGAWINIYHGEDSEHRYTCSAGQQHHDDDDDNHGHGHGRHQVEVHHHSSSSEPFGDNEPVYVKVGLYQHSYKFIVKKVVLCTGKDGDPSPYDPNHPDTSGCNTPHVDMHRWVLYDLYEDYSHTSGFNFTFVRYGEEWQKEFCFNARVLYYKNQMLHVDWEVEPLAHSLTPHVVEGDGGVLSLLEQQPLPFGGSQDAEYVKRAKELHRVLYSQRKHFQSYQFNFKNAEYMRPPTAAFVEKHREVFAAHLDQEAFRERRLSVESFVGGNDEEVRAESTWGRAHHHDDDDHYAVYDYYYHDNNPVTSVNQQCFVVRCPVGYSYLHQSCVHNTAYAYYGYTGGLSWWWFLLLLFLLFICLASTYFYSGNDYHQAATPYCASPPTCVPEVHHHCHHHHHHHQQPQQHPLAKYGAVSHAYDIHKQC